VTDGEMNLGRARANLAWGPTCPRHRARGVGVRNEPRV